MNHNISEYFKLFFKNSEFPCVLVNCESLAIVEFNTATLGIFNERDLVNFVETEKEFIHTASINKVESQKIIHIPSGLILELLITPININDSNYVTIHLNDVTEREKGKEELEQTQETYKSIYNNLPDGVINHFNGKIVTCNDTFVNLVSKSKKELIGKKIEDLFAPEDYELITKQINNPKKGSLIIVSRQHSDGIWHKYTLESFKSKYYGQDLITSIVSNYQLQEDLAKEQLRANLASEANILLEKEIQKHKETQRALRASQEISKSVFNSSIDNIISSDLKNRITEVSPSACYTFGYEADEFVGIDAALLYADQDEFKEIAKQLNEDGYFIGEITNVRKDGTIFTSFLSCAAMRNDQGNHIGYMGISRDITDLKKAEQELKDSELKYRDLFLNLSDSLIIVDEKNNFLDINLAAKKLLQIDKPQGYNLYDFVFREDLELIKEKSKEIREKGKIVEVEFRIVNKEDNEIRYINLSSTAILNNGEYIGSRDILRDITEQKKYQDLINTQNSHLESIFENQSDILMWTLSSDFKVTSKNSRLSRFIKSKSQTEVKIGDNFLESLRPYVDPSIYDSLYGRYSAATEGKAQQFEGVLKYKDEEVWMETFLSPIKEKGKEKYNIACMALDITDKKLSEIELTKSLEEKEVLLKEVHHRVKNNLQVISSILNLQSSYVKDENTLNILRESQNRVKSMSFIHESLYRSSDFSSINFAEYMDNLIKNVIHSFLLPDREVDLKVDLSPVSLNLDQAIPCGLIVNEILTNAMKYAFDGIEDPTLIINLFDKETTICIHIEDNGIGLPEDFVLEETDSLGLQLVHTLIEQLDGTLEVKSKNGTKYFITFEKIN